jgi:hypothetical protein
VCRRYELPAEFASLMIQYRYGGDVCVPRYFDVANETVLSGERQRDGHNGQETILAVCRAPLP